MSAPVSKTVLNYAHLLQLRVKAVPISDKILVKENAEARFWLRQSITEGGVLQNDHYEYFYTEHFGFNRDDYVGQTVLDIGCGPRGSLNWLGEEVTTVGVDPLAHLYRRYLEADDHPMEYVESGAESIPFPDDHFDFVSSFNSLDHVDDPDLVIDEIQRVLAPEGHFLLLTDVGHQPTTKEPIRLDWDVTWSFDRLEIIEERHYEKTNPGLYTSIIRDIPYVHHEHDESELKPSGVPYDHENDTERYGILSALFRKPK